MATSIFFNVEQINGSAMEVLEGMLVLPKFVNRDYDTLFKGDGAKHGDVTSIRLPGNYTFRTGKNAVPQGYNDSYKQVTLSQYGADIQFTSKELALNVDDFKNNVLAPVLAPLAAKVNSLGYDLYSQIPHYVGTPGTAPTDLSAVLDAGAFLTEHNVPNDGNRFAIFAPRQQASIINGLKTLYNPVRDISKQYETGNLGELSAGFKCSVDESCPTHTTGTFGTSTPEIDGSTADGATTLRIDGWASGASQLKTGDIISVQGVYDVNPITKRSTGQLKKLVVTADYNDTSGTMAALPISPALILTGPNQNIDALPVNNADVYVYGLQNNTYSNKTTTTGFIGHRNAIMMVGCDLPMVGPSEMCSRVYHDKLKMSMRLAKAWNPTNDEMLWRFDLLVGWALLRPDHISRLQG